MPVFTFQIEGMTCDGCARHLEQVLQQVEGVERASFAYAGRGGEVSVKAGGPAAAGLAAVIHRQTPYRVAGMAESPLPAASGGAGNHDYALIIIGGGSAAFSAALEANRLQQPTLLINEGLPLGGTCVNVGCVPSKFMVRAGEQAYRAAHSPFAGVAASRPAVDFGRLVRSQRQLVAGMQRQKYLEVLDKLEYVTYLPARACLTGPHQVEAKGRTYTAAHILIATGASAAVPDVPGLAGAGYLTYRSLFGLGVLPQRLAVLGGSFVALELAQAWHRLGSRVQIIHRSERLLRREAAGISAALTGYLRDEGLEIRLNTVVEKVVREGNEVQIFARQNGRPVEFAATHLLVATGMRPNTAGLGLEQVGVEMDEQGRIKVNNRQQTTVSHIWAAGDCTAAPAFVYTAAREGKVAAVNALTGSGERTDYTGLPWVLFTDPQVAGAGLDEATARAAGYDCEAAILPLSEVPRAITAGDTRGFISLVRDRQTDRLLGVRIVAPEGGELAQTASMAIRQGLTVADLAGMFYPYLTLSEGLKLAALTFTKDISELSCCAT